MFRPLLFTTFISLAVVPSLAAEPFRFDEKKDTKTLNLVEGEKPIFSYVYDIVTHENVPKKDRRRNAGCYIHPLYGLNGEIFTDNAPQDHYHHHGIFWTWPYVGVKQSYGRIIHHDLWASDTGLKQRHVRWLDRKTTEEIAMFSVENGWFDGHVAGLPATDDDEMIMKEIVQVTVHRPKTDGELRSRAIDFAFVWTPTEKPITLRGAEEKSYGGLTIRFRPYVEPGKKLAKPGAINVITVPSGPATGDLPETPLAWADYTSRFSNDDHRSGAAFFTPKTHPDYPPTWLTRYYGPLCIGWPGVKERTFKPGEEIKLNYRLWIHDGPVNVQQIEKAYAEYCSEKQ